MAHDARLKPLPLLVRGWADCIVLAIGLRLKSALPDPAKNG
jgi:hypothetical protein